MANTGNVLEYDLESIPVPPTSDRADGRSEFLFLYNAFRDQGVTPSDSPMAGSSAFGR